MFTTVAFLESVDPAGAYNALTAIADQHIRVSGDDLYVPSLSQIIAVAAGIETAAEAKPRLTSPSLRGRGRFYIEPYNGQAAAAVEPDNPPKVTDLLTSPLKLISQEQLNAEVDSNPVAAQIQWCVVWLADGPVAPVLGDIFTVDATNATTLVGSAWTNGALTFSEDLPRGRYQVVGMRARSAGLVAARLVFIGGVWRPGCLGCDAQTDLDWYGFRGGVMGVFGEFEDTDPPSVDFLSVSADTAQDVQLDLIQMRAGPA